MGEITTFPAKVIAFPAASPLANAYGFEPVEFERPVIDVTAGVVGFRVWVRGCVFREFRTLTNAARCASALRQLHELGCLDAINPTPETDHAA